MVPLEILRPVTILAAWSMTMWLWMYATRLPALTGNSKYDARNSIGSVGADIRELVPPRVQWKADNYNHLMEQPTIFYAVGTALALLGAGNGFAVVLAWVYVGFRIVHSLVQVTVNRVLVRFVLHAVGTLPLIVLTGLAVVAAWRQA